MSSFIARFVTISRIEKLVTIIEIVVAGCARTVLAAEKYVRLVHICPGICIDTQNDGNANIHMEQTILIEYILTK